VQTSIDPDGRLVELTTERWDHIVAGHPELEGHLYSVLGRSDVLRAACRAAFRAKSGSMPSRSGRVGG
jgi:hypothetical protein